MSNRPQFENLGSLITYKKDAKDCCLGYLMEFPGHGVYDAELGRVEIDSASAIVHNALLDRAILEGLDKSCQIGQAGTFYFIEKNGGFQVTTFLATVVSRDVSVKGKVITFHRGGKTYRGHLCEDAEAFNFRRVA